MRKILLSSLVLAGLGLLVASSTIAILAHGSDSAEATPTNDGAWEAMHEACETGDWEAMAEAAEEVHDEDLGDISYHGDDYHTHEEKGGVSADHWGGMGGHMGGGMMGRH